MVRVFWLAGVMRCFSGKCRRTSALAGDSALRAAPLHGMMLVSWLKLGVLGLHGAPGLDARNSHDPVSLQAGEAYRFFN